MRALPKKGSPTPFRHGVTATAEGGGGIEALRINIRSSCHAQLAS